MHYGEKISYLRKSNGMTQEELGKVLNVTYQAVSKWERGESLPDFNTMSQIAKFFQVPLSYFEEGGEIAEATAITNAASTTVENGAVVGLCMECGKMLKEEDVFSRTPKVVCKSCAERIKKENEKRRENEEKRLRSIKERELNEQLGKGVDTKLIISIVLTVATYILFTVLCFTNKTDTDMYATLLMLVPIVVFACLYIFYDFIGELREDYTNYDSDDEQGYRCVLSLIVGGVFAAINGIVMLILYFSCGKHGYYLTYAAVGTVVTFTFISQYMWGNFIKTIFTCGGFTFKLPGFIFSLSIDSILFMIIAKLVLGLIAALIMIATTILVALVAIFVSVVTFIPCVIYKLAKDRKAKEEFKI